MHRSVQLTRREEFAETTKRIDGPNLALHIGMKPQIDHALTDTQPSVHAAIAPPLAVADPLPAKVEPIRIENEARGAWFHAQAAIGLVASQVERIMTKVFNALDNRQKPQRPN